MPTAQTLSRYVVRQRERRTVASLDTKPKWTQKETFFLCTASRALVYTRSSRLISISLLLLLNHSLFDRHFVSLMTRRP